MRSSGFAAEQYFVGRAAPAARGPDGASTAGTAETERPPLLSHLRALAVQALARMYRPEERLFAYRLRRTGAGLVREGASRRYTAIALIGLAGETREVTAEVLGGAGPSDVVARLAGEIDEVEDLGEVALTYWASRLGRELGDVPLEKIADRLLALRPADREHSTVELAWTLTALSLGRELPRLSALRDRVARRLMSAFSAASAIFPHDVPEARGVRSHVSCFADLVYPIQALSHYHGATGDPRALEIATGCARAMCRRQGSGGQWWWHYDSRTGRVIEPYPVYSVHQDGMAPMALFALMDALDGASANGRVDFTAPIARGMRWLERCPELGGASLIDDAEGVIWRKVARADPRKLVRILQAAASRVHPALRVPGLDVVFPPRAVDHECRPYHLGWLLHAWPAGRATQWTEAGLL